MTCPDPTHNHSHAGAHNGACCVFHMIAFGFPTGAEAAEPEGPPPSLQDATPKKVSQHALDTAFAAEGFYRKASIDEPILIKNATVLTMDGRKRLENHDVMVRGRRIEAVAPTGELDESGALVIEAAGKFLTPGFADMHLHVLTRNWTEGLLAMANVEGKTAEDFTLPLGLAMLQYLVAGITRIEVMAGDPDMLHMRDLAKEGAIASPRMRVGSPLVDGPIPIQSASMSWRVGDAQGGAKAADMIAELGYDFAKPYSNLPAAGYEALLKGCEARGIPVLGHVPIEVGAEAACEAGRQDISHAADFFYWLNGPERYDLDRQKKLAKTIAEKGRYVQATVAVGGRMESVWGGSVASDYPDIQFCNPLINSMYEPGSSMMAALKDMPHIANLVKDSGRLSQDMTRHLHAAGVKLVTGTDAPNAFLAEGFSLHEEIQIMVEDCGLSDYDGLEVITVNAADCLGIDDEGTIKPGNVADLCLLDDDPSADIKATRSLHAVIASGALLDKDQIAAGRRAILGTYADMPVNG